MSKYTGKSDFYDTIFMHYSPEEIFKSDIYTYDGDKIDFKNEGDMILYGPYLIGSMAASKNEDGTSYLNIHLSKESYIDEQEKDKLFWYYITIKNLILKSKECLKDINNPKFIQKYSVDLDKKILLQVYTYIIQNLELKDLMVAYPLKKFSYGDSYWQIEKMVSDKIMGKFHLTRFNNKRIELLDEYGEHSNKLSLKAINIQNQINEFNRINNSNLEEL